MRTLIQKIISLKNWFTYTGLWIPIPLTTMVIYGFSYFMPHFQWTITLILLCFFLSFAFPLHIWTLNRIAKANGKQTFPLIPLNTATDPLYQVSHRTDALFRKPPEKLLYNKPTGIVLGKYHSKYVCLVPDGAKSNHLLCIGTSGSGKTSTLLADTLLSRYLKGQKKKSSFTTIMVDVKGELEYKFFFPEDDTLAVFNPRERNLYGFDFLWDIDNNSSETDVLSSLRRVVYSLIPIQHNQNGDKFWADGSRNISLGLFLYGWIYKKYRTLPDLVDFALSKNLKELINDVLLDVSEYSAISKLLTPFGGKEAAEETLSGLSMGMGNAFQLIATDDTLRFLLRECDKKIDPSYIEKGINIDIQISDAYLNVYSRILSLAVSSCCFALCTRPEGSNPVLLIIDEVSRIAHEGQIEGLQQLLQIGRSRGCSVILALQTWCALESIYSSGDCKDMLNNLQYRLIMQCNPDDRETTDMCIKAFGKYQERKKNITTGRNGNISYSFEEKDVLREDDLLTLPERQETTLLSPYGAFFLKRCPYYRDPLLKRIANSIKKERNTEKSHAPL